jgi:hypothetical protein
MLKVRPLAIGDLRGSIYTFEAVGDELPVHAHDEATNHITIVTFGAVACFGEPGDPVVVMEAKQGSAIYALEAGQPHGFRALTAGASIVNLQTMADKK